MKIAFHLDTHEKSPLSSGEDLIKNSSQAIVVNPKSQRRDRVRGKRVAVEGKGVKRLGKSGEDSGASSASGISNKPFAPLALSRGILA